MVRHDGVMATIAWIVIGTALIGFSSCGSLDAFAQTDEGGIAAALPPPVRVIKQAGERIIVRVSDGASVTVPPRAALPTGLVTVEVLPLREELAAVLVDSVDGGPRRELPTRIVGNVYDIFLKDQTGRLLVVFGQEIEVSLPYTERDLREQGLSEDEIVPSFFNENVDAWVKIPTYTIDRDRNVVVARVSHLTRFALVVAADIVPPGPPSGISGYAETGGRVVLQWVNPARDFNHIKIYRSLRRGELGSVFAREVLGVTWVDQSVADGNVYFYTIRSVDAAGNESENTSQVAIRAIGTGSVLFPPSSAPAGGERMTEELKAAPTPRGYVSPSPSPVTVFLESSASPTPSSDKWSLLWLIRFFASFLLRL